MALGRTSKDVRQRFVIDIQIVAGCRKFGNLLRNRFRVVSLCSGGKRLMSHGECVESCLEFGEQFVIGLLLVGKIDKACESPGGAHRG